MRHWFGFPGRLLDPRGRCDAGCGALQQWLHAPWSVQFSLTHTREGWVNTHKLTRIFTYNSVRWHVLKEIHDTHMLWWCLLSASNYFVISFAAVLASVSLMLCGVTWSLFQSCLGKSLFCSTASFCICIIFVPQSVILSTHKNVTLASPLSYCHRLKKGHRKFAYPIQTSLCNLTDHNVVEWLWF